MIGIRSTSSRSPSRARAAGRGLVAVSLQLAAGEMAAALRPGIRSPVTGLGRALIDVTPGPAVDVTVALLEARDKPLLMGVVLTDFLARGAVAGVLAARRPRTASAILVAQGLVAGGAAATRADSETAASALAGAGAGALGAGALALLGRRPGAALGVLGAAITAGAVAQRRNAARAAALRDRRVRVVLPAATAGAAPAGLDVEGLAPLLTPNNDFYETDVTFPPPALDAADWRLRVHGRVERELSLSFDALLALGTEELDATLVCVHNPVGGPRIGTARWLGVPVRTLLDRAGVRPGANQLLARSVDGFSAGVPLDLLAEDRPALVALGMNGEPLGFGHGYPARLLVPGLYGYDANVKWLAELELTTFAEAADYWTRRGWPREPAHVRPSARIDVPAARARIAPGPTTLAGVAWAPPHGVSAVEVCVDDGGWRPAALGVELAPTAWRQWSLDADLPPGAHRLRVRTAGQDEQRADEPPFPRGAAGVHEITVTAGPPAPAGRGAEARAVAAERATLARSGLAAWARHGRRSWR